MRSKSLVFGLVVGAALGAGVAARAGGGAPRRVINGQGKITGAPYSDAVLVGDTLYLSGRIGFDPKTGKPPADPEAEARLVLGGMKETLVQAGMTMDDLVQVQVYCPDLNLYDTFNKVYRTFFKGDPPARAFIGSGKLLREGRFEVIGVAVRR